MLYRTPRFDEKYDRHEYKWHLDRNEHHDHTVEFKRVINRFTKTLTDFSEYPNISDGYDALRYIFNVTSVDVGKVGDEYATFILSNGSDEALKSIFWYLRDKKTISIVDPTYQAATVYTKMYDYKINSIPYVIDGNTFTFDFEKFISSSNVLYIASPDNITGSKLTDDQVKRLVQEAENGKIVIFDLAYEINFPHHLHNKKNVILVGTVSKFFAGAFLRVGYISSTPDLISDMYQYKTSYEVTGPGVKYLQFLANNLDQFCKSHKRIEDGRNFINTVFNNKIQTYGNFCLLPYDSSILSTLKTCVIKECIIDGKHFIRLTATDKNTFRKILNGKPRV